MISGKILIVDDEKEIREVFKLQLYDSGYHTLEASNGEEAIAILRTGDNMINVGVILCDIRMPKVNGIECIDFLRKEAPGIPIVVITGYPDMEMSKNLLEKGVKQYLVKPVTKERLLETVNEMVTAGKDWDF